MAEPAYVGLLANELRTAETELQTFRTFKSILARFINNPAIALDIRQGLARDLRLPAPEK
jgi:hypothetical protein